MIRVIGDRNGYMQQVLVEIWICVYNKQTFWLHNSKSIANCVLEKKNKNTKQKDNSNSIILLWSSKLKIPYFATLRPWLMGASYYSKIQLLLIMKAFQGQNFSLNVILREIMRNISRWLQRGWIVGRGNIGIIRQIKKNA